MSAFTTPVATVPMDPRELHPREYFNTNAEDCAHMILLGLPDNPNRLCSLWTLVNVSRDTGIVNTPAECATVSFRIRDLWLSFGFIDADGPRNTLTCLQLLAAMDPPAACSEFTRTLCNFFMKQTFPHVAVSMIGRPNALLEDKKVIIRPAEQQHRMVNFTRLAKGGYGVVEQALKVPSVCDNTLLAPIRVAVKNINIAKMAESVPPGDMSTLESRLKREIANSRLLDCPHIVPLLDYFSVQPEYGRPLPGTPASNLLKAYGGSHLYLTMELFPGTELFEQVVNGVFLATPNLLRIALSRIGRAVLYLHAASIIHRDIKPENIGYFYDESIEGTEEDRVMSKLFDFGLSKQIGSTHSRLGQTAGMGTQDYRAPEIAPALGPVHTAHGFKVDVYSFGITMAVCFGREKPIINPETREIDLNLCRRVTFDQKEIFCDDRIIHGNVPRKCPLPTALLPPSPECLLLLYYNTLNLHSHHHPLRSLTYSPTPLHTHATTNAIDTWQHIPPLLKDCILKATRSNPEERMSMSELMQHPFWDNLAVGAEEMASLYAHGQAARQRMNDAVAIPDLF